MNLSSQNQEMATDFLLIPQEQPPQEKDLTIEPSAEFSMLHLSPPATTHRHHPCRTCGCHSFNPMKRRSPESQSESSRPKKLSCDQEDHTCGFSSLSLPLSLESLAAIHTSRSPLPVFRRCFSDPYTVPSSANGVGAPLTPNLSPENGNGNSSASRLPPRPPSLKRCVSDPSSTPGKMNHNNQDSDFSKEEISDLMRMRRMKDRLREMKKWWDEVMEEEEREDQVDEANKAISVSQVDEGNKDLSVTQVDEGNNVISVTQDDSGIEDGAEEIVSVEWVEKSLCVNFKCPCGKGYQILLSGNKCYYKLV